jgi:hypothetical protein
MLIFLLLLPISSAELQSSPVSAADFLPVSRSQLSITGSVAAGFDSGKWIFTDRDPQK